MDHTGDSPLGFGSIQAADKAQTFSRLEAKDLQQILTESRLYPSREQPPACAALTVGDDEIDFAAGNIVECRSLRTVGTPFTREDSIHFTYSEEMMKWNRQLVSEASAGALLLPEKFGLQGKYRHENAEKRFKKNTTVCLTASIALPKVRVILDQVSVSEAFVQAVDEAVGSNDPAELMRRLACLGISSPRTSSSAVR